MLAAKLVVPGSSTRLTAIEDCRPELQALHALWQRLRGDRRMPARSDFDPADAVRLLPHILLVDVVPQVPRERRFRIRLHGTAQVNYLGSDWTGSYPHQKTDKAAADKLCDVGDYVVASHEPWMSTGQAYYFPDNPYSRFESILLPLSDDGEAANMILGLTIFF